MTIIASVTKSGYKTDGGVYDEVSLMRGDNLLGTVLVKLGKNSKTHGEVLSEAGYKDYTWDFALSGEPVIPLEKLFFNGHNAPISDFERVEDFKPFRELGASRYRHFYRPGRPLDALLVNKGSDTLFVHLHGATERTSTVLPRFERLATIANKEVTSLYFSDPTLHVDENIQLTWYTGWEDVDVQRDIAMWIQKAAAELECKYIVVAGSSGGGFASLQISALIPGSWALPMNPQTSIHKYYVGGDSSVRGVQRAYIKHAHPEIATGPVEKMDLEPDWTLLLGDETSVVRRYSEPINNNVVFVQNTNDWHFEQHWLPFKEACAAAGNLENVELITYSGPKAHVAPDKEAFEMSFKAVMSRVHQAELRDAEKRRAVSRFDERYDAELIEFGFAEEIPWDQLSSQIGHRFRISVRPPGGSLPLEMLYIPRASPDLLIGLHGAEQRSTMEFPKFQFVNSFVSQRTESLLFLADSTLTLHEELSIGWMAGNAKTDLVKEYSEVVNTLNAMAGHVNTVLAGHSAGATVAIRMGAHIPNSTAVAVNPQLSVELHRPWLIPKLREAAFSEYATDYGMLSAFRERLDLTRTLTHRESSSRFYWFSHAEDTLSFQTYPHFPAVCDFLRIGEDGGTTQNGDRIVKCRWETTNPNKHALPGSIIPFIEYTLGESTGAELLIE